MATHDDEATSDCGVTYCKPVNMTRGVPVLAEGGGLEASATKAICP